MSTADSVPKGDSKPADDPVKREPTAEEQAGWLSQATWYWLSSVMELGVERPLQQSDLPDLTADAVASNNAVQFEEQWRQQLAMNPTAPSLTGALYGMYRKPFILAGVINTFAIALQTFQPTLLKWLIVYVAKVQFDLPYDSWEGPVIAVGMFLCSIASSQLTNQYFRIMMNMGLNVRTIIITSLYRKSLKLSPAARANMSTGQVVNMMSSDASRLDMISQFLHTIWLAAVQVIVIIGLLISTMGVSALAGLAVTFLMSPVQGHFMRKTQMLRGDIAKKTDARVKLMNEILQGIRVLKVYAWENSFMAKLAGVRQQEMDIVMESAILRAIYSAMMMTGPTLMSVAAFIVYGATTEQVTAQAIFSALVYFNQLRFPLMMLPMSLGMYFESRVAVERITKFLVAAELDSQPERLPFDPTRPSIEIQDAAFCWEVAPPSEEKEKGQKGQKGPKGQPPASAPTPAAEAPKEEVVIPDVLKNINVSIKPGSLVAVIGAVGSGKSSLLAGLLGELKRTQGHVRLSGSVAYCPQQAWIQNANVRENILFGMPFDQAKYDDVIKKCTLTRDLEVLLDGDMTEIGEKGINLSGGQKARVNLARAVYVGADIMLLDDPLSAVDAHVSKYLFEECINGVMKGKTRVLVTHQLQYLSSGKFDHIIVLKDGGIFEQGSYEELMQSQGEMHRLLMALGKEEDASGSESESEPESQKTQPAVDGGAAAATAASADSAVVVAKKRTKSAEEVKVKTPEKKKATALMTQEERQTGSVSWEIYFYYFRSWGMVLVPLTVLFFTLTAQGLQTANNWWLSVWSSNSYNQSYQFYLGVYGGIAAASVLMVLGSTILLAYAGQRAAINMHNVAFFNLMRAPTSFFDTTPIGRILNRFSRDQDVIDSMMVDTLRMTFTMIISAVFTFVMIMIITPWFIVPFIPVMFLYYRTQTFYRHCSREIKRLDAISRSPLYSHFGETLTGLSSIRAYAEQDRFIKQNELRINDNNRAYYIQVQSQRWLALRLDFTGALIVFFAALVSSLTAKSLSPGLVGLSLSYALQVTGMLTWMIRQTVELENNMNSVERSKYYTDSLPQEAPAEIEGAVPPKGEWPSAGAISVRGLQMRYRPELDLVLDGVSLDIKGGEKIGVVGRTGAGKSSLMVAMFRLVEAAGGSISIDGIDISKVGLQDLRSRMAIIPQDPVLYSGSLRANLDPFNQYTDEEVWFALDRAYMRKAVEALDAKLDAPVTENGDNFSVGQRCQICLARALLRKAKVLILDEATASIDMETDALIQQTIRSDFKDCTILTIAHRLNTVVDYDRVLVLSFGKVKEFDTPANLLRDPRSDFCSMVAETGAQNAESLRQMAFDKESRSQ